MNIPDDNIVYNTTLFLYLLFFIESNDNDFLILILLLHELSVQVSTAQVSLFHAASTRPMYPVIHCIRYTLQKLHLR